MSEQEIYIEAINRRDPAERRRFLDEVCAGNEVLRGRIETLIRQSDHLGSFLENSPQPLGATPDISVAVEKPGTQIGPYKLLQQIGEGGMGTVYMAEQTEPIARRVALKIIKLGMDTRQVIARFEAERQALAMMDHVNIARVLDAGTTEAGRSYFVMELVHGVPITKYCDDNHLRPRERLELFVPACQAIQHAHQKGIIHRDIKPSNVMVTLYDGKPVPKVIDFGVAKATEQKLTERTLFTQYGTMVGTLEYMSPEQAEMSALGVDTRSDIYSLGVLLYELLTGSTPLTHERMKDAAYAEILRMIKDEEPPKPSTRLSDSAEALASISANRHTEPAKLTKLMRGELDWIVMKALEKDRNRRYETAKDFAADVQRYLEDEPVQACPPTVGYRMSKLVRRHQGPVLAASLVLLVLVAGMIGTTWGMLRATDAEAVAVNEAKQKDVALTDKVAALTDAEEQLFQALVNRARAERVSGRIGQRFEALKAIRAAARIRITPELRTEAMAALVLPDTEVAQEWERSAEESGAVLVFDASFQRFARVDKQGGLAVWEVSKGREEVVTRLNAPGKKAFWGVAMSQDARFVACRDSETSGVAGRVRVWKVGGPELLVLEPEPAAGLSGMVFHPDSRQLAICNPDKTVSVYDLPTGRRLHRLAVSAAPFCLDFHPRDHRLAVACGNAVQLFDTDTGKELPSLCHPAGVTNLSWHPNGRRLAAAGADRKIHVWDTQTATEVMSPWTGHTADGIQLAFNHAGDRLVSSDWGAPPRLWDAATGRTLLTLPGFEQRFSSDDRLPGPATSGTKVALWRFADGRELRVLRPSSEENLGNLVYPVVHPDGRILAAAGGRRLCFFDLANGEELASVQLPVRDAALPVFFDSPHLSQGSIDASIHPSGPEEPVEKPGGSEDQYGGWMTGGHSGLCLWPARPDSTRPEVMRIGPPQQIVRDPGGGYTAGARASADGRVVALPQGHSTAVLFRDHPDRHVILGPQFDARFADVSPDGRWVVTCSWGSDGRSNGIRIWDADSGLSVRELPPESYAFARFSSDGRWLMLRGSSGNRQWEVGTWREVRRFELSNFAFSPDSRLLAISDVLSVIRLLETATGREVARLTGPEPMWYSPACFTQDGIRLVATCSGETAVYVWDLRLIRQQLKTMGLDWEWPDFPPADPDAMTALPPIVEVVTGDLAKLASTPEQRARQTIKLDPKNPRGHIKLGDLLFGEGKLDEASACYQKAIELQPDGAKGSNEMAWLLATCPEPKIRNASRAVELAKAAVDLAPQQGEYWNTLGVAHYRAGDWPAAVTALNKSGEIRAVSDSFDMFFLAMAHWQQGSHDEARKLYDQAVAWMNQNQPENKELLRFRAEAEALLGVKETKN
jgi:serine/threonine protein kinase/WD40 repeat protein/Tfp pilus assembly protein PilF